MSLFTLTVKSAGQAVPAHHPLLSVDVRRELNRQPTALLVYQDGDAAERTFSISDSKLFAHGTEIQILIRYEGASGAAGQDAPLFKGLVVRHGIEADANGSVLRVELRDKAIALTRPRRSRVVEKSTDSDLITKLAKQAGLRADITATTGTHASLVQYDCSDWDWLVTRAEANGLVVVVQDGTLRVKPPVASDGGGLRLNYGIDEILELAFECDALGQDASFTARSWNPIDQLVAEVAGAKPPAPGQGQVSGAALASKLGFAAATLLGAVPLLKEEAKGWADSEALRAQLALVRGHARIPGVARLALLDGVDIAGVAKAFNGKALLSGLCHRIDNSGWTTDLQFGLSPQAHRSRPDIAHPPAAGLLPAVGGLQIGVVVATHDDPDQENRVQVKLPGLGGDAPGVWARMASPDAGKGRGWYFWPEPGDEVVLGFFNDDPRQPVVLGSLFGSKNAPPVDIVDASSKNNLRGLVTRSGLTLSLLDDEKAKLLLQTPGGAKLLLDDDAQAIVISDKHGNKLTLDKDGINITSAKDFLVDASGNVEIKGSKVDLK